MEESQLKLTQILLGLKTLLRGVAKVKGTWSERGKILPVPS